MRYTKKQRKQIAEVFKEAQKHLWPGKDWSLAGYRYICIAIQSTDTPWKDRSRAAEIVQQRLGEITPCVESWLYHRGYIRSWNRSLKTLTKIQQYRLDWLKELEREFSQ